MDDHNASFWYCSLFPLLLSKFVRISQILQSEELLTVQNLLLLIPNVNNLVVKYCNVTRLLTLVAPFLSAVLRMFFRIKI